MIFLLVNTAFYDRVNIIHEDIITANPYPYTCIPKFAFVVVRSNKDQQLRR